MKTLFISDLHLSFKEPETRQCFLEFLKTHSCDVLYILGDFFEAWIGDDNTALWIEEICEALRSFPGKVYFMQGNRDFLLGKEFAQKCNAELLSDPVLIDLYGVPTVLTHGDLLCTEDSDYQKWRKIAHNKGLQWLFLRLPLSLRSKIAQKLRNESMRKKMIVDVSPEAVKSMVLAHQATQIIHGHTHRPAVHTEEGYTRYVLPDWHPKGGMVLASPHKKPELVIFN